MALLMTHSLLSSWMYSMQDNPYADSTQEDTSLEDFLRTLRREPIPTNEAMQNGIDFENLVTNIANGTPCDGEMWFDAAQKIARIVKGGQFQYVAKRQETISGIDFLLYGRFDVLKAGHIYDIKFSKGYERGKYFDSTQHPMYLRLMPEAEDFTYLVSNGVDVWSETYRRDETPRIEETIYDFVYWLNATGYMDLYKQYWEAK